MSTVSSMKNEEFEYREVKRLSRGRSLVIRISKVGGGTVGRAYGEGQWIYRVSYTGPGPVVLEGDDLRTGAPRTHAEVAEIVFDFLPEAGER